MEKRKILKASWRIFWGQGKLEENEEQFGEKGGSPKVKRDTWRKNVFGEIKGI